MYKVNCLLLLIVCTMVACTDTLGQPPQTILPTKANLFPATIQFSPVPSGMEKEGLLLHTEQTKKQSIKSVLEQGFGNFWIYNFSGDTTKKLLNYAQSLGMQIDYMTSGFEIFDRYKPSAISVYAPDYIGAVKKRIATGLAPMKEIKRIHSVFPFQDEPFHAGPEAFDFSVDAKLEFDKRYGYEMPSSLDAVRNDPKKWLDLLNFQSNTFRDGWIKVYKAVKEFDPRPKIVMTHDSHNTFGAGVKSNSKVAMDDVFYWGGDFADVYVYNIYPYMTFDYRYGEFGKLPKPRISQMHYTIAQLRNLTSTYGKEMGFWVGTYNELWFTRFRGPERKNQYWSEREISYTAIGQGANFLISPSNYNTLNLPLDTLHWQNYTEAMKVVQQAGPGLLKAPKVKAKACFLFPRTQYLQLQEEYFNVGLTFELFLRAFGELDIIHEEQITNDHLNGYKVLVLADVKLLPEKTARNIASFVQRGGIVIADCVPQMDAYQQPLQTMNKLFGVERSETDRIIQEGQWVPFVNLPPKMSFPPLADYKPQEARIDRVAGKIFQLNYGFKIISPRASEVTTGNVLLKMKSGQPALVSHRVGEGKTYLLGFCMQDTYFDTWKNDDAAGRKQLRNLISGIFNDAKINAHIYSSNPDIEASVRANPSEGYLFIINHEATDPQTTVRLADLDFPVGKIVDIESGKPVTFSRKSGVIELVIKAPFATTRLLRILPKEKANY